MTIGNQWYVDRLTARSKQQSDRIETAAFQGQSEADAAIAAVPDLIKEAKRRDKDSIRLLGRPLEAQDAADGSLKQLYLAQWRNRGKLGVEHLLGAARTVATWCLQNGFAWSVKRKGRKGRRVYWLKAEPRPAPSTFS